MTLTTMSNNDRNKTPFNNSQLYSSKTKVLTVTHIKLHAHNGIVKPSNDTRYEYR